MTERTNSADDIIELTDIVEEASSQPDFDDFPMEKAIDAKSLDDELDALLNDTTLDQQGDTGRDTGGLDFESLFKEAEQAPTKPSAPTATAAEHALGADLSDLDDLFEALQTSPESDSQNALDAMLAGDNAEDLPDLPVFENLEKTPDSAIADDFDGLDLDIPELDPAQPEDTDPLPLIAEKTKPPTAGDLLAALDVIPAVDPLTTEELNETVQDTDMSVGESGFIEEAELHGSRAELENLSARLDALETGKMLPTIPAQHILSALPETLDQLPFAEALQAEIATTVTAATAAQITLANTFQTRLDTIEANLAAVALGDLQKLTPLEAEIADLKSQVATLSTQPDQVSISPEDILAALPAEPDQLPFAAALRQGLLDEAKTLASDVHSDMTNLQRRIESLETKPAPTVDEAQLKEVDSELGTLRKILQHQEATVLTLQEDVAAKNQTITAQKEEIAALGSDVRTLKAMIDAQTAENATLRESIEAASNTTAELRSIISIQGKALETFQDRMEQQTAALAQAVELSAKLEALQAALNEQDGKLGMLTANAAKAPDLDQLKSELSDQVLQQVPAAAAAVVREEIAALLKELGE